MECYYRSRGLKLSLACTVLSLLTSFLTLMVFTMPYWRVVDRIGMEANMQIMTTSEGLWIRCTNMQGLYYRCFNFRVQGFGVGLYLNAYRAFMVIALISSLVGVVCSILGMKCTNLLDEDSNTKRWVVIIGGIGHIAAGILTGIAVSWYAAEVVYEFYSPYYQTTKLKYTLGACLYLGWISMLLSLLSGILMACCTCFKKSSEDNFKYPVKTTEMLRQEYNVNSIYNRPPPTNTNNGYRVEDALISSKEPAAIISRYEGPPHQDDDEFTNSTSADDRRYEDDNRYAKRSTRRSERESRRKDQYDNRSSRIDNRTSRREDNRRSTTRRSPDRTSRKSDQIFASGFV